MPSRTIAIGDIHGCAGEFSALLDRLQPTAEDRIVLLGDLINRGPDSIAVIEMAQRLKAVSLIGNHEQRLLEYRRTKELSNLKKEDLETLAVLRREHWLYLESMPLTYHAAEYDMVFVHGGFLPGMPWRDQPAEVVTRIQAVDAGGRPRKKADCPGCPAWADLWQGPPYVIYGHTPRMSVYESKWALGIDTGCVYGGCLTACVLPEKKFVQEPARRRYHP